MAKPKCKIYIEKILPNLFNVYCDNPKIAVQDISGIEGVTQINYVSIAKYIQVVIDPRYDIDEIIAEVKGLLEAEVPDIFKD